MLLTLFSEFKTIIGEFHLTPADLFEHEYGAGGLKEGTVISWVLPVSDDTVTTNQKQKKLPSWEWAFTRFYGEKFNDQLTVHLDAVLKKYGYRSVIPPKKQFRDPRAGLTSFWSERHVAFTAGLGTFSLNDGLITAKGIAHRCGSLITDLLLEPTKRNYTGPYNYCLHYQDKSCGICIRRCPAGAITKNGHDKDLCENYIINHVKPKERYGLEIAGCGLCQTSVPCEKQIP